MTKLVVNHKEIIEVERMSREPNIVYDRRCIFILKIKWFINKNKIVYEKFMGHFLFIYNKINPIKSKKKYDWVFAVVHLRLGFF